MLASSLRARGGSSASAASATSAICASLRCSWNSGSSWLVQLQGLQPGLALALLVPRGLGRQAQAVPGVGVLVVGGDGPLEPGLGGVEVVHRQLQVGQLPQQLARGLHRLRAGQGAQRAPGMRPAGPAPAPAPPSAPARPADPPGTRPPRPCAGPRTPAPAPPPGRPGRPATRRHAAPVRPSRDRARRSAPAAPAPRRRCRLRWHRPPAGTGSPARRAPRWPAARPAPAPPPRRRPPAAPRPRPADLSRSASLTWSLAWPTGQQGVQRRRQVAGPQLDRAPRVLGRTHRRRHLDQVGAHQVELRPQPARSAPG